MMKRYHCSGSNDFSDYREQTYGSKKEMYEAYRDLLMCCRYSMFTCASNNIFKKRQSTLSRECFCTTFCSIKELRDLLLSSSLYGYWLSNFQHKNAFRRSLLGFVFKLQYSLLYVSSIKFTDLPPNLADSHA